MNRAVRFELEWYFGYAQAALRRNDVGILPSHVAVSVAPTDDRTLRRRAKKLAQTVSDCLFCLSPRHASVLRAAYTPRRWPRRIEQSFRALAPIVVRLALARSPWPGQSSKSGLERAVAVQLSRALGGVKKARLVAQFRPRAGICPPARTPPHPRYRSPANARFRVGPTRRPLAVRVPPSMRQA
jgi:hypothetical protein